MPTKLFDFPLYRAKEGILRALRDIKQVDGYENSPKVQMGHISLDKVPDGEFPMLALEMGDLAPSTEQFGGSSQGLIRWIWPAFIAGYVRTSGNRAALYDAGLSLLVDLWGAVWADEGLTDGAGQPVVLFANPGEVVFDMEAHSTHNRGFFLAEFQLVVDIKRGASP